MTSTTTRLASYAAAGAVALAILTPATAMATTQGECRPSATTVATKTLKTSAGKVLGRARITIETIGGTTVVCGIVEVRKPFRKHSTLVTLDLRERSDEGADLGRAKAVERATKLSPPTMTSSFEPTGNTFIFKAKVDIGATAKGRAVYTVP